MGLKSQILTLMPLRHKRQVVLQSIEEPCLPIASQFNLKSAVVGLGQDFAHKMFTSISLQRGFVKTWHSPLSYCKQT